MAIVIIGGHSRSVGKTSVVVGLISALSEFNWTAFKITQYGHGVCSRDGKPCDCACADHSWAISEEKDRSGESDTSRFLVAGAVRAWWVRTEQGRLAEAMPTVQIKLAEAENAILESNSMLEFLRPDLCLTVLDPANRDFKRSARKFLELADGIIMHAKHGEPVWTDVSLDLVAHRPMFRVAAPEYVTPEVLEFVRKRLGVTASSDFRIRAHPG
jgi:hypothetical protein